MGALRHIRENILGLSQAEMAVLTQVSQGTVSKWEAGKLAPSRDEMARIRAAAIERGIAWNDAWFFASPAPRETSPSTEPAQQDDEQGDAHADRGAAAEPVEAVHAVSGAVS